MTDRAAIPWHRELFSWTAPATLPLVAILAVICLPRLQDRSGNAYPSPGSVSETQAALAKEAMRRIVEAQKVLATERRGLNLPADLLQELAENDPADTGLIGLENSPLTTTPGFIDAKRLSTDPRWGAAFVGWYAAAGLKPGDQVAIASSGSFPAVAVAARIAAEVAGLKPLVVQSLTASNYGANIPGFDSHHMEQILIGAGLLKYPAVLITPGGDRDVGSQLDASNVEALRWRLNRIAVEGRPGVRVVWPESENEALTQRMNVLGLNRNPKESSIAEGTSQSRFLLVNIGGSSINVGTGESMLALRPGLTLASIGGESIESSPTGTGSTDTAVGSGDPKSLIDVARSRQWSVLHILYLKALWPYVSSFPPSDQSSGVAGPSLFGKFELQNGSEIYGRSMPRPNAAGRAVLIGGVILSLLLCRRTGKWRKFAVEVGRN
jgi:poly-gamma-glutamate system protein